MDILTEFDELQEALKKVKIDEDVMIYRNGMLVENQETINQMTKILKCPEMINCHQYLYDCDPENLTEDEISKIDKLYKLACNRKYIDNSFNDELAKDEIAQTTPVVDVTPVKPAVPKKNYIPCWTVLYSATDSNGNAKCGECYSNSVSVSAAKADALAKLNRFGYNNIAILAIEAGDPDMCGCEDPVEPCEPSVSDANNTEDITIDEDDDTVSEQDILKDKPHNLHHATLSETADQSVPDSDEILSTSDFAGDDLAEGMSLDSACEVFESDPDMMSEAEFENCVNLPVQDIPANRIPDDEFINAGKIDEDDEAPAKEDAPAAKEAPAEAPAEEAPVEDTTEEAPAAEDAPAEEAPVEEVPTEDTTEEVPAAEEAPAEEAPVEDTTEEAPAAEDAPAEEVSSEDTTEEVSDEDTAEDADDSEDSSEDADDEDTADDNSEDDDEDSSDDDDDSEDEDDEKNDDDDESESEELDDTKKAELKDKYSSTFKTTMKDCDFTGTSFNKLTLKQKVKFFTKLSKAWKNKHQPEEFMTDKQKTQLENVVIPEK